jgi:hypothetical protein
MEYQENLYPTFKLCIPKKIAEIRLCGTVIFSIAENSGFIMPTEEQRKNLKDLFCIEVIPIEENANEMF